MSTVIVIFGATGDLTARKLIPALYNNFRKKRLPEHVHIIGYGRKPLTSETFRVKMKEAVKTFAAEEYREEEWSAFASHLFYQQGELEGAPVSYTHLTLPTILRV